MRAVDVDRYRKRYEAELAKAVAPKRRRAAVGVDARASAAVRADALKAAPLDEENLDDQVAELLATLLDRKEPVAVRMAALQALGALDFLGARFDPFRAEYKEALRQLATDPRRSLRERALERLAIDKDSYAQELLVRGLERPEEALVSEARAIQFLAYDDHAAVAPLARKVYKRATGAAREEAVRVLATDPQSEKLLARLMKDKTEKSSIRRISASGLQSLNPDAFERAARKIVADEDDYNEIRATTLAALAHGREIRDDPVDLRFVDTVQKVAKKTRSTALRSSSKRYLNATET
jgi:hypothetical protein